MIERLVRMFSFVGDTVLDPFTGTGTTNLAAAKWGRNSIGWEVVESYFDHAAKRLEREATRSHQLLLCRRGHPMTTIPDIPDSVFHDAIVAFWDARANNAAAVELKGMVGQGERAAVTAGQQLNGFIKTIVEFAEQAGVGFLEVKLARRAVLPGYFRATKNWDLLIIREGVLLAAIELKSQAGSFGNNVNNRAEESIGSAVDLWTAFRENAYGAGAQRPWLGYLFVLEDHPKSTTAIRENSPHLRCFPSSGVRAMRGVTSCCSEDSCWSGTTTQRAS